LRNFSLYSKVALVVAVLTFYTWCAFATTTKIFTENSYNDFVKGELKTTSLSSEGELFPAPEFEKIWEAENELIWRIVKGSDNTLFLSTGNDGKIYRKKEKGKPEMFCDLEEVAAFALALDKKGRLFAGASPGGKIYVINQQNKPELFFETKQEYIWDLVFDKQGNLFAATGTEGKLFRITPKGEGELYYEAPDKNLMDILIPRKIADSSLYLSSHDKGRIYRVYDKDKAFVLYDSGMDEVRSLAEGEKGYFYASLNTLKTLPTPPTSRKDNEKNEEDEEDDNNGNNNNKEERKLLLPFILGKKSSVVKIDMAGYVWTIFETSESPIHCLMYDDKSKTVLSSIGEKGRLYRIQEQNKHTLTLSTEENYILSMMSSEEYLYYGTGKSACLYQVNWNDLSGGEYISPVHDAKTTVLWGKIHMEGALPAGTEVNIALRSGNTAETDKTWSEWTKEQKFKEKQASITCPVARFFQYKLLISGKDQNTFPVIRKIESFYRPPNHTPEIQSIQVSSAAKPKTPPKPPSKSKSDDKSTGNKQSNSATAMDTKANSNPKKLKITWKAKDPEGDTLEYSLYFKGKSEALWKEIEEKTDKPLYMLSTEAIPDGEYQIKIVASDIPSNPPLNALETFMLSDVFIIDNSPPVFLKKIKFDQVDKNSILITARVQDDYSIISTAQYSSNAKDWFRADPEDEIFDSKMESFAFLIEDLEQEEIVLTLMITDAEGNTAVEKLLVDLKEKK